MAASRRRQGARAVVVRSPEWPVATRDALEALSALADAPPGRRVCIAVGMGSASYASPAVLRALRRFLAARDIVDPDVLAVVGNRDRDAGWDVESLCARHDVHVESMVDAWTSVEPAAVGDPYVIDGRPVPIAWQRADVRVVLAPCATDAIEGHALVLDILASLVPSIPGADPVDVVADILQTMPPDVCVIDATMTSDGPAGTSVRQPVRTDAVIASTSAILSDLVGATLLGADPMRSELVRSVVDFLGLPEDFAVSGDLTSFPGITYPPEPLLRSTRAAPDSRAVKRVVGAALADEGVNTTGDDVAMTMLRQAIRPWLAQVRESPSAPTALAWTSGGVARAAGYAEAWRTTFAKGSMSRRVASLGLELTRFTARDYEAAESTLRPLLQLIDGLPVDRDGLRWRHIDGAVLFEASRTVRAPYESWIERVDVSQAISMMADYLGGRIVVVGKDRQGRTTRQAERNIYLPQPNYVAFSGGRAIDVCKLSVLRYRTDSRAIWWRTVRSPNRSAVFDDGTVEFSDAGEDRTRVVIRGRQQFHLPASLEAMDLDLAPDVRDTLTQDAYHRFFLTTLDNFEACFEGRDFAVGREPDDELPTLGLSRLATVAQASVADMLASASVASLVDGSLRVAVDDDGFTHVPGARR